MPENENPYQPPQVSESALQEEENDLANRSTRLAAAIIDSILMMAITFPALFVFGADFGEDDLGLTMLDNVLVGVIGIAWFLTLNGYLLAKRGQTLGKLAFRIKIVRKNGDRISFGRIVGLRLAPLWIASYIPIVGQIFAFVDPLFIFRKSRYCLHDDIADSKVVKVL